MSLETTLTRLIRLIAKRELLMQITEGTVSAVDKTANTCTVDREDMPQLLHVRLNAILEAGNKTFTIYPSVGSSVLCAIIENNATDAYMIDCNEIESIVINGGENGGMCITPELKTQLDKLTARVDGIIDAIKNATPSTDNSGAGLKATMVTALETLTDKENFSNIEDTTITH